MPQLPRNEDIVIIVWRDAVQGHRGNESVEDMGLSQRTHVGWILHENEHRIILCRSKCIDDGEECVAIPVAAIEHRERVARIRVEKHAEPKPCKLCEEYANVIAGAMDESCDGNERHCTCVPTLRTEVKRLQERLQDVKEMVVLSFLRDVDPDEKKDATLALCQWCLEGIEPSEGAKEATDTHG